MAAARFDALVERPLASLSEEQRAAAALLGLDEEGWAAVGARARKLDEGQPGRDDLRPPGWVVGTARLQCISGGAPQRA